MKRTLALVVFATTLATVMIVATGSSASKRDIAGGSLSEISAGASITDSIERQTFGPPIIHGIPELNSPLHHGLPGLNMNVKTFKVTCVDVMRVQAYDGLAIYCRPNTGNGDTFAIPVASWADGTGKYPVGHDEITTAGIIDARRNASIAPIVTAFIQFNEAHPSAVLEVSGFHSKLPAANGRRVADLVQFDSKP